MGRGWALFVDCTFCRPQVQFEELQAIQQRLEGLMDAAQSVQQAAEDSRQAIANECMREVSASRGPGLCTGRLR